NADRKRAKEALAQLDLLERKVREASTKESDAAELVPEQWRLATPVTEIPPLDLPALRALLDEARAYGGETQLGLIRWLRRVFRGSAVRREIVGGLDSAMAAAPEEIREDLTVRLMQD